MSSSDNSTGEAQRTADQGRLAQVIATRGGTAEPEAPLVIEHREALIYMLCLAAELEHTIMCQYLFAAFSLKQSADEGLSADEVAATTRWRQVISHVAAQEMLHLALVQNLLSAIGAAPHLGRPNLPVPADHYPAGVQLALLPFGEQALRHFMFLERPEGMGLDDAEGLEAVGRAAPMMQAGDIVPRRQDFATVGHLYRSIELGFAHLVEKHGERWLFAGPPRAQATQVHFRWPDLVPVTGVASAQQAIDTILEQGEGARGDWRDAHFGQFVKILDEYQQMKRANPTFEPVRPVLQANVRPCERDVMVPLITDPVTARVADLFNVAYEILLQIFQRFFAHTEETDPQLMTLADATIGLMLRVIKPLGDMITTLPAGPDYPGQTTGPSFELFYESDYLMPHRDAAWVLLTERLDEAASFCATIPTGGSDKVADRLEPVRTALREIAGTLAVHLPPADPHARRASVSTPTPDELRSLRSRADELASAVAAVKGRGDGDPANGLTELFDAAYKLVTASGSRSESNGGSAAGMVGRLVDSVMRPLADAISRHRAGAGFSAGSAAGSASDDVPVGVSGDGQRPASAQDRAAPEDPLWEAAKAATRLRARLDGVGAPPELAEATAALQALACQSVQPGKEAERLAALWDLQGGLPATIQAARGGPYLATNVPNVYSHLGERIPTAPQVALCRCGGSSTKPFCDGTHAHNGFTDAKDPNRVPDQRDTYPGQQVTILDNRGVCQHSGLCTDRLASVFRAGEEPFVAPSGGRMDEIIRAVRDCPSGALSFGIDGEEARTQADWSNQRDPAIEITRDGPYRITGGITLVGADGEQVERNAGSSLEHCALCRCGHSQNKPFCSGMHWYVEFRDPVPVPGREPTLFEWAGGLPALTRMARLLYEKHVPADPLLAPLFADIPPDQARREAVWLGEVFGGPAAPADERGGYMQLVARRAGTQFNQEQRVRWVELAGRAAQDAGLPADPEFSAAFAAYIEWGSRLAVAQPAPGAQPADFPVDRWGWSAAGSPDTSATSQDGKDSEDEQPAALPGPDEPVSFGDHIKPLFRERDRRSMTFAFDLWSGDDVRAHATGILQRLRDGSMPCDGAWTDDKIGVFQRWVESGMHA